MTLAELPQNVSAYEMFINPENFRLAWERVRYFDRIDSRDWVGLKVFAANRDHNLEVLRQAVIEKTFEPSYPEIKYLPKSSLTLRPMAVLAIPDRVVLQALANVVAEKARFAFGMVANRQSFANVLDEKKEKRFFIDWKLQYRLFQNTYVKLLDEENLWVAETDVAAFYETIEHTKLYELLLKHDFIDEHAIEYLKAYLPVWSTVKNDVHAKRGVPQGCLASDLLANIYLFEFDHEFAAQEYYYLRYVDDIRILGKTKESVQRGLIRVDIYLKALDILLQTKKTKVREVLDKTSEKDHLSAELSELDHRLEEIELTAKVSPDPLNEPSLHDVALLGIETAHGFIETTSKDPTIQEDLSEIFWSSKKSIDSDDSSNPYAERHLKFCLYRLQPDEKVAESVIPYLVDKPWLNEVISIYLKKCKLNSSCVEKIRKIITTRSVYDSVIATSLDILLIQKISLRVHQDLLRQWLSDETRHWVLRCSAALCLGESTHNISILHQQALKQSNSASIRRMCLVQSLRLAKNPDEASHIIKSVIRDTSPVVIDTLLYQLYSEWSLTLSSMGVNDKNLADYCIATAKGYDNSLPNIQPDYIRYVFSKSYKVDFSNPVEFHALLGADYRVATERLWKAENSYLVNIDRYISQLDLFHEELLYPILVDILKIKPTREELAKVELTNRIETLIKNKKELIGFGGALQECRLLRANPEMHTRLHHQLIVTSSVSWQQRNALKKKLIAGYQELVNWLIAGCP